MQSDNPILNSPYEEPLLHYNTAPDGSLNYNDIRKGRRIYSPDIQVIPTRQGPQENIFGVNDLKELYNGIKIKNKDQKIAVRIISLYGEESTKIIQV